VENRLEINSAFKLPGKKALKKATGAIEYVVVDVTENPIQRHKKKTAFILFWKKETTYHKNADCH
jgi:hypothetical protein